MSDKYKNREKYTKSDIRKLVELSEKAENVNTKKLEVNTEKEDTNVVSPVDAIVTHKRKVGRPKGSKNKPKNVKVN